MYIYEGKEKKEKEKLVEAYTYLYGVYVFEGWLF